MADASSGSVNAHECSWGDLKADLNVPDGPSVELVEWEGFKWARKLEVGETTGVGGGGTRKRTRGKASYEGSGTATRAGWCELLEALEAAAEALGQVRDDEVIISGIEFDVIFQHTPLNDTRIYAVKLVGCRFMGDASDMKAGNEADMIEQTFNPRKILTKSKTGKWLAIR